MTLIQVLVDVLGPPKSHSFQDLRLVFATFPSCSQMSVVFYHIVIHVLSFFICQITFIAMTKTTRGAIAEYPRTYLHNDSDTNTP